MIEYTPLLTDVITALVLSGWGLFVVLTHTEQIKGFIWSS